MCDFNFTEADRVVLAKAQRYCARQEQCCGTVRKKLSEWGADTTLAEKIIDCLIAERFLDDRRFARFYCADKLRLSKWGPRKIAYQLKMLGVSDVCVSEGLSSVPHDEQMDILRGVVAVKRKTLGSDDVPTRNRKLTAFLLSRGFLAADIRCCMDSDDV